MTRNSNEPRQAQSAGVRENSSRGGAEPIVGHTADATQQDGALFPTDSTLPIARPVPVQTSGRLEFAARCPECHTWHRHISLGKKAAPCGTRYVLKFKGAA